MSDGIRDQAIWRTIFLCAFNFLLGAAVGVTIFGLALAAWGIIVPAALVLGLLIYCRWIEPRRITLATYRQSLVAQPQHWLRVVFLSDLHASDDKSREFYERVTERVMDLRPDLILFGGDAVDSQHEALESLESLACMQAPLGKFFLLGNHDLFDDPQAVRLAFESWGFSDLTNRAVELERNGRMFELVGLDDAWYGAPDVKLVRQPKKLPRLLVLHEPDGLQDVESGTADLILTGHTHGGQVRLPLIGALVPLPQTLPRYFDRGMKDWKKIPVIISQGLGESNFSLRFNCPPQIVVVEVGI